MHFLTQLLTSGSRKMSLPVIAILAGWYVGAKYGAPDYVINTVDGVIAKGGDMAGALLPGDDVAPAEPAGEEI